MCQRVALNWNVPQINGECSFFTPESFTKYNYQVEHNLGEYLRKKTEELSLESINRRIPDEKPDGSSQSNDIHKEFPVSSGRENEKKAQTLSTGTVLYNRSAVPLPRKSWLNVDEQRRYLELFSKYSQSTPSNPTEQERIEMHILQELQTKVTAEQEEFQTYLKSIWNSSQSYNFINPQAKKYIEEKLINQSKRVKEYPRYYETVDGVSLTIPPDMKEFPPLVYVRPLLELGCIPKVILPNLISGNKPTVCTDYNKLTEKYPTKYPLKGNNSKVWNKEVCSQDVNGEQLATKYQCQFVISSAALKCLLDNQAPNFHREWQIPFVVRQYTASGVSDSIPLKVIYIDKPLVNKNISTREKNEKFHKTALKNLICNMTKSFRFGTKKSDIIIPVNQKSMKKNKKTESLNKPSLDQKADNTFDVFDTAETQDLETFGTSIKPTSLSHKLNSSGSLTEKLKKKDIILETLVDLAPVHASNVNLALDNQVNDSVENVPTDHVIGESVHSPPVEKGKTLKQDNLQGSNSRSGHDVSKSDYQCGEINTENNPSNTDKVSLKVSEISTKEIPDMSLSESHASMDKFDNEVENKKDVDISKSSSCSLPVKDKWPDDNKGLEQVSNVEEKEQDSSAELMMDVKMAVDVVQSTCTVDSVPVTDSEGNGGGGIRRRLRGRPRNIISPCQEKPTNESGSKLTHHGDKSLTPVRRRSLRDLSKLSKGANSDNDTAKTLPSICDEQNKGSPEVHQNVVSRKSPRLNPKLKGDGKIKVLRSSSKEPCEELSSPSKDEASSHPSEGESVKKDLQPVPILVEKPTITESSSKSESCVSPDNSVDDDSGTEDERLVIDIPVVTETKSTATRRSKRLSVLNKNVVDTDTTDDEVTMKTNERSDNSSPKQQWKVSTPDSGSERRRPGRHGSISNASEKTEEVVEKKTRKGRPLKRNKAQTEDDNNESEETSQAVCGKAAFKIPEMMASEREENMTFDSPASPRGVRDLSEIAEIEEPSDLSEAELEFVKPVIIPLSPTHQPVIMEVKQEPEIPTAKVSKRSRQPSKGVEGQRSSIEKQENPLSAIMKLQDKMLHDPMVANKAEGQISEHTDGHHISLNDVTNRSPESQMMKENPADYQQPSDPNNITYHLWSLAGKPLLIRSSCQGYRMDGKQVSHVGLSCKLEYQTEHGYEARTASEVIRDWATSYIRQNSPLIRARINGLSSELLMLEETNAMGCVPAKYSHLPPQGLQILGKVLSKLETFSVGTYLLNHTPGEGHCQIRKAKTDNKIGPYDLHFSYTGFAPSQTEHPAGTDWRPIDTNVILPFHWKQARIPATFDPPDFVCLKRKPHHVQQSSRKHRRKGKPKGKNPHASSQY